MKKYNGTTRVATGSDGLMRSFTDMIDGDITNHPKRNMSLFKADVIISYKVPESNTGDVEIIYDFYNAKSL